MNNFRFKRFIKIISDFITINFPHLSKKMTHYIQLMGMAMPSYGFNPKKICYAPGVPSFFNK